MHHLTKIITDGMSALLYVLCVQFSSFLLWCQCRLANQIRQFIKLCGVQIHLPCISGLALYHDFQDENPRETESNVVVIVYNCYSNLGIKTCLLNPKLILQISAFGRRNPHYKRRFSAAACFPFPAAHRSSAHLLMADSDNSFAIASALLPLLTPAPPWQTLFRLSLRRSALKETQHCGKVRKIQGTPFEHIWVTKPFTKLYCDWVPSI